MEEKIHIAMPPFVVQGFTDFRDGGLKDMLTADVLIPVYRPGKEFAELLKRLSMQSCPIRKIIIMNTEKAFFPEEVARTYENLEIHHLTKAEFDHGGTRDKGIRKSSADIVICMTQDAVPADRHLIGRLLEAFDDPEVWAAYARQIPRKDCSEVERYTRSFNYPEKSCVKGQEDLEKLGVKTYFCSNVCAAWRRGTYLEQRGFEKRTIFNEDMILAGKLVQAGGKIAYCADAQVIHSHNYSAWAQFQRYFDLAVSQVMHPEVFQNVSSESEGMRLVKKSMLHCMRIGKPWLIFTIVMQNAGKLLGYKIGQRYEKLPKKIIRICTMNRSFWEKEG